jgi:signal peptidase I
VSAAGRTISRSLATTGRILGRVGNIFALLVAVGVIASVGAIGAALAVGYRPVVITGGSMGANVPDRAMVVAQPVDEVAVGDVLVMRGAGRATVTHRIVELEASPDGGPELAVTRGDANPAPDATPYPVGDHELIARWVVPGLGSLVLDLANPLAGTALIGAVVLILVLAALSRIWPPRPGAGPDSEFDPEPSNPTRPATSREPATALPAPPRSTRFRLRLGVATVVAVLLGVSGVAWSLYLDSARRPANQFSTRTCYHARLDSMQQGSVVNTTTGTQTVTIAAVDMAKSFLVFSVRSDANEPDGSRLQGVLATSTSITLTRPSDDSSPPALTIEWSVVSYACGVSVQRGTVAANGASQYNVTINAVTQASSFVLGSSAPGFGANTLGGDDLMGYSLTSGTNLRIQTADPVDSSATFAWQVVTFDDPADATVQTVSATLGPGAGTTTVNLPTPVELSTTFVLAGPSSASTGDEIGERVVRARLLDGNTVEMYRAVTTESITANVQVVSLADGSTVQNGVVTMAPTETTKAVTIDPVDVARSTGLSTVMEPGVLSGGSSTSTADDIAGEASATVRLTNPSTLSVQRGGSISTATFAWQVVTWGGPGWADTSYSFRQRVDIETGNVDAPNGYTTSDVLDHQALVSSGLSLASGNDLRLWRYDGTSWTEIDRVLDTGSAWNASTTTLWFKTQESIAAGNVISYWLYFGKPTAGSPPANADNVWLLREGFESGLGQFEARTTGTGWYSANPWTRRIVLTIKETAVDTTLTGQPVMVRLTSADVAANAQSDGSDIRFTASDGTTPLSHELESYEPSNGTLTAWVMVPSVDATADIVIHLYYGAANAPAQANPRAVWDNELAAWHLARSRTGPAPSLDDSSPNQVDGLALGDTALIDTSSGPAADLDGTADRLESSPRDLPDGPLTVSAWFQPDTVAGSPVLVSQGDPSGSGVFELAVVGGQARFRIRVSGALVELSGGTITAGTWNHITATWTGTTITLYVNGTSVGTTAASGPAVNGSAVAMVLGGDAAGSRVLDGQLGEARLSDRTWSASEVRFAYQNLLNPATTVVAGAASGGSWFSQGTWNARRPIVVDADLVAGDLMDYPLLLQLIDSQLAASAQADGDDLVFVAADGTTRLDYELESWNGTTGALTAWVRIPNLGGTVDSTLFVYASNASARSQEDLVGVWGRQADLVLNG